MSEQRTDPYKWCNACQIDPRTGCRHPMGPHYCPLRAHPDVRRGQALAALDDKATPNTTRRRAVAVDDVARSGSLIVGLLSTFSLLGSWLSGFDAIQPFLALLLLVASVGFYCMTLVPTRAERLRHDD